MAASVRPLPEHRRRCVPIHSAFRVVVGHCVLGGSPLCQRWSRHRRRHHVHRSKARHSDHHALLGDRVRAFRTHLLEVITLTHYMPRATPRGASSIDKSSFAPDSAHHHGGHHRTRRSAATKADVRAIVREELAPIRSELKSIRRDLYMSPPAAQQNGQRRHTLSLLARSQANDEQAGILRRSPAT
jgi:hypothetical protein